MVATLVHEGVEEALLIEGEGGHLESEKDWDIFFDPRAKASNFSESLEMDDSVTT